MTPEHWEVVNFLRDYYDEDQIAPSVRILDKEMNILEKVNNEFPQHYPEPGWVEHDPDEIWACTQKTLEEAIRAAEVDPDRIAGIGITNQRETTVLWDRKTGKPVHNDKKRQERCTCRSPAPRPPARAPAPRPPERYSSASLAVRS
jgi:hypothetical protein